MEFRFFCYLTFSESPQSLWFKSKNIQAGITPGKTLDNVFNRSMYLFILFYVCLSFLYSSYAPIIRLVISISEYRPLFLYRYLAFLKRYCNNCTDNEISVLHH